MVRDQISAMATGRVVFQPTGIDPLEVEMFRADMFPRPAKVALPAHQIRAEAVRNRRITVTVF